MHSVVHLLDFMDHLYLNHLVVPTLVAKLEWHCILALKYF